MRELKPLHLPQLVEARKKDEQDSPVDTPGYSLQQSQSLTASDLSSPSIPASPVKILSRLPSSTSSLASSPVLRESMDGFAAGKRPLTEVKEEPHEREEDYEMVDGYSGSPSDRNGDVLTDTMCSQLPLGEEDVLPSPAHYDLSDDYQFDNDFVPTPSVKRRRANDLPFSSLTQRFGSRMPSLSKKWLQKKDMSINTAIDAFQERPSRASSTRAPSLANSYIETDTQDHTLPLTPAMSASGHQSGELHSSPIDLKHPSSPMEEDEPEVKASTPLLPPVMANLPNYVKDDIPYQSPLQSPTVADRESVFSSHTPSDTPQLHSLPSPPLSTKPSISSFHRQRGYSQSTHHNLTPTCDIPPLPINLGADRWADRLGHANFLIVPEPYLPTRFDLEACQKLRSDWEAARWNFTKHLMRTSEHHGATSMIHKLTEEKWAEIDGQWKQYTDICMSKTAENGYEAALCQSQHSVAEPAPLIKVPSLNGPNSEGKFPTLGDEGLVGPLTMTVNADYIPQHPQQRKPAKRSFLRFLQGMLTPAIVFGRPSGQQRAVSL
ncbi:MAG: hypothetical protein LQ342_008011 [Letrouitia transgressa]|nr:MAG: hypothetical protein LQ342_008011 [Letrouitia transgressa]